MPSPTAAASAFSRFLPEATLDAIFSHTGAGSIPHEERYAFVAAALLYSLRHDGHGDPFPSPMERHAKVLSAWAGNEDTTLPFTPWMAACTHVAAADRAQSPAEALPWVRFVTMARSLKLPPAGESAVLAAWSGSAQSLCAGRRVVLAAVATDLPPGEPCYHAAVCADTGGIVAVVVDTPERDFDVRAPQHTPSTGTSSREQDSVGSILIRLLSRIGPGDRTMVLSPRYATLRAVHVVTAGVGLSAMAALAPTAWPPGLGDHSEAEAVLATYPKGAVAVRSASSCSDGMLAALVVQREPGVRGRLPALLLAVPKGTPLADAGYTPSSGRTALCEHAAALRGAAACTAVEPGDVGGHAGYALPPRLPAVLAALGSLIPAADLGGLRLLGVLLTLAESNALLACGLSAAAAVEFRFCLAAGLLGRYEVQARVAVTSRVQQRREHMPGLSLPVLQADSGVLNAKRKNAEHVLRTACKIPKACGRFPGADDDSGLDTAWDEEMKQAHGQQCCVSADSGREARTFCTCSREHALCEMCCAVHLAHGQPFP